jgi:hypothetical protein
MNTEALVAADGRWYLMPMDPETSNECYTHTGINVLLNILMTTLHTCILSVVVVPCCRGSVSEQLRFDAEV